MNESLGQKIILAEKIADQDLFKKREFAKLKAFYLIRLKINFHLLKRIFQITFCLGILMNIIYYNTSSYQTARKEYYDGIHALGEEGEKIDNKTDTFGFRGQSYISHYKLNESRFEDFDNRINAFIKTWIISLFALAVVFKIKKYFLSKEAQFLMLVDILCESKPDQSNLKSS